MGEPQWVTEARAVETGPSPDQWYQARIARDAKICFLLAFLVFGILSVIFRNPGPLLFIPAFVMLFACIASRRRTNAYARLLTERHEARLLVRAYKQNENWLQDKPNSLYGDYKPIDLDTLQ